MEGKGGGREFTFDLSCHRDHLVYPSPFLYPDLACRYTCPSLSPCLAPSLFLCCLGDPFLLLHDIPCLAFLCFLIWTSSVKDALVTLILILTWTSISTWSLFQLISRKKKRERKRETKRKRKVSYQDEGRSRREAGRG